MIDFTIQSMSKANKRSFFSSIFGSGDVAASKPAAEVAAPINLPEDTKE